MADLNSTAPSPRFILALMKDKWTVSGALCEFIDNSFGEHRGNASVVHITWKPAARILTILDNGSGIAVLRNLFQLGSENPSGGASDPGYYGSGGTKALIYLGRPVEVISLRRGRYAYAKVNWQEHINTDWPSVRTVWHVPDATSPVPDELLEYGQGTLIRLTLPPGHQVNEAHVRRDLAEAYGPGLRSGRQIFWHTVGRHGRIVDTELTDPIDQMRSGRPIVISFPFEDAELEAHGTIGINADLGPSRSGIRVGYGFRQILFTKEPFRNYSGVGVTGYVDLVTQGDRWLPLLTTTKDGINDDRARGKLMESLHRALLPLLKQVQQTERVIFFKDIGEALARMLFGTEVLTYDPDGDQTIRTRNGGGGDEPKPPPRIGPIPKFDAPTAPASPKKEKQPRGVEIVPQSDVMMEGRLCHPDVRGDHIVVYLNEEYPFIQNALKQRPPNRVALAVFIAQRIAPAILKHTGLLARLTTIDERMTIANLSPADQEDRVTRHLLDGWMASVGMDAP